MNYTISSLYDTIKENLEKDLLLTFSYRHCEVNIIIDMITKTNHIDYGTNDEEESMLVYSDFGFFIIDISVALDFLNICKNV